MSALRLTHCLLLKCAMGFVHQRKLVASNVNGVAVSPCWLMMEADQNEGLGPSAVKIGVIFGVCSLAQVCVAPQSSVAPEGRMDCAGPGAQHGLYIQPGWQDSWESVVSSDPVLCPTRAESHESSQWYFSTAWFSRCGSRSARGFGLSRGWFLKKGKHTLICIRKLIVFKGEFGAEYRNYSGIRQVELLVKSAPSPGINRSRSWANNWINCPEMSKLLAVSFSPEPGESEARFQLAILHSSLEPEVGSQLLEIN